MPGTGTFKPEVSVSNELAARMAAVVPGGVNSNVRLEVADVFFARGEGARLWDVDGRDYVDYLLGQGPAFLGHGRKEVVERVTAGIAGGMTFAAQTPVELAAAELLVTTLGWPEMVRIGVTSTETVQAALRVSRSVTGRTRFLRFRGHYHGWLDDVLLDWADPEPRLASKGQLRDGLEQSVTVEWNDLDAVRTAMLAEPGGFAAVIMEPMMLNAGAIEPSPGYLEGVRALCAETGTVLIFDETITGFRVGLQGAVGRFGVVPDLAIYGKAVAGGFPASVLAGSARIMSAFAAGTTHAGTFNANTMACHAIVAALELMRDAPIHATVEATGTEVVAGLRALFAAVDLPLVVRGVPAAFHVSFDTPEPVHAYADLLRADGARYRRLVRHAREAGIWLAGRGVWYVSAAHDRSTTAITMDRMRAALRAFRDAELTAEVASTR